ncbi:MAG: hypothetical protein QOC81_4216 [Thermoanaerobaculia bacterium]|jgi:hypothetical protein|nr:hypothetical protein [Thermoanaerobaculia bacterium]
MRKLWRFILVLLVVFITSASFAQLAFDTDYNYFSDGTFSYWVGEEDYLCNSGVYSSGQTSDWRTRDRYSCANGQLVSHGCQELVNGSWTPIVCPPGV